MLVKAVAQSNRIGSRGSAQRYILDGRTCRTLKQFTNEKDINERIDKRMLAFQTRALFEEVYKYREGC
jgi:hypothetical protein